MFKSFLKENCIQEYNTYPLNTIKKLEFLVDENQIELSFLDKTSLFLQENEDVFQSFMKDFVVNYTYKIVFNHAYMFYLKRKNKYNEDSDLFISEYYDNFIAQFVTKASEEEIKDFLMEVYELLLARDKSSLNGKVSTNMKKYAFSIKNQRCYICGVETEQIENGILPGTILGLSFQKAFIKSFKKAMPSMIYNFLKIKFFRKYIYRINNYFLDEININKISSIINKAKHKSERKTMSIEHNFPLSWGGAKNDENLRVSCNHCNSNKKNIVFYTDYSISRFFINDMSKKLQFKLHNNLGFEALLSLKMRQNYECIDCKTKIASGTDFYIMRINYDRGFYLFNLQLVCSTCYNRYSDKDCYAFKVT